ncbi:GNAT family N-acetyltransferase [Glaciibacter sp. 2TAF33]|uniref:GNAT family N-acetyltransferase n=1 Tax=Glaciibacter sp. 2TAF33 TaxID=3233015 RepID=UPI003F8F8EBF
MEQARFTIDELSIPDRPGAEGWDDFVAMTRVRNEIETAGYGNAELSYSAEELLPIWRNQAFDPKRLFVARVGGRIIARGAMETVADPTNEYAWLEVQVLPEWRRRGVGTAMFDRLEDLAVRDGRTTHVVYTVSPDAPGERLPALTGFGSVPVGNAEVRFLLRRGYRLEQVERGSRLPLPVADGVLEHYLADAAAHAGADYDVRTWMGAAPPNWRDDLALLYTRMSTDAPSAGLEEPEDVWTVERLLELEAEREASPRTTLTAVALHLPSGRLAGYTELSAPPEIRRAVAQEDTLVLREHRGHRLGMLLKAANLLQLARLRPGHPAVTTFNAEENRHMLIVNEALGFVPMGYEGAWKRVAR